MTVLRVDTISGIGSDGPVFDGDLEFNSQNYVILPKGTTGDRVGLGSTAGALRYNTDSNKVELWDGNQWAEVQSSRPDLNGGARGIWSGYQPGTPVNVIQYVNISSTGNAIDFGDSTVSTYEKGGTASSTRGVWGAGFVSPGDGINTIDYVTIASTGNAQDFGDLTQKRKGAGGCGSSTRGLFTAGLYLAPAGTYANIIDYITIASTGNAVDFGDTTIAQEQGTALSSPTRGIIAGGEDASNDYNTINFVTISTTGNAQDFGDLTLLRRLLTGGGNATRGIFGGGRNDPNDTNIIDYITIASTGNAVDFGDFSSTRRNAGAVSSPTRVLFAGGSVPGFTNTIDYVIIATQGNPVDFGDTLAAAEMNNSGCSNAHGGL